MKFPLTLLMLPCVALAAPSLSQAVEPLRVAALVSNRENDNPAAMEEYLKWLEEHYQVQLVRCVPEYTRPETLSREEGKQWVRPHLLRLDEAEKCQVVLSSLCNFMCREDESKRLATLLTTKPLVGLKRSHHGFHLFAPKGETLPGYENYRIDVPIFGMLFFGHYHGKKGYQQMIYGQGQEQHPIVRGLDSILTYIPEGGHYEHAVKADDVTPLVITGDGVMPQIWVRVNKTTGQRLFYTRHDPIDLTKNKDVRTLVARALFWAVEKDEALYRKP